MDFSNLRNYIDYMIDTYNAPSVDCIVCKDHKEIFRYYNGYKNIENKEKIVGNELYLIFSMTKLITCVGALTLFEKGKYTLADPLALYLPEFKNMKVSKSGYNAEEGLKISSGTMMDKNKRREETALYEYTQTPITVRDLFTMSAGFDYNLNADYIKQAVSENKTSTIDVVSSFSNAVLKFEPGTGFNYSLCHDVLGALIEIWSGQSFGEYIRENILEPLGMKDTFFGLPKEAEQIKRTATRYIYDENRMPKLLPTENPFILSKNYESGGAGMVSSTKDYAILTDALACGGIAANGKRILSPLTVDLMKSNHLKGKQCEDFALLRKGYGYGLGVRTHIDKTQSGSLSPLGEFGWDGAAGGFSMIDTENRLSMTLFQHIHGWDVRFQTEIRNVLYSCL